MITESSFPTFVSVHNQLLKKGASTIGPEQFMLSFFKRDDLSTSVEFKNSMINICKEFIEQTKRDLEIINVNQSLENLILTYTRILFNLNTACFRHRSNVKLVETQF